MAYKGLRDWMEALEKAGLLKHIKAKVDWDLEVSGNISITCGLDS
jgi:3-polyprenyl-4-hydroxybenzoate decarboxylase